MNSNRQGQDWPLGTVQQCTAMHSTVQHFTAPPFTLPSRGAPRGSSEPKDSHSQPLARGVASLEITVHGAFCTSAAPRGGLPCSPAVLAAAPTPPGDGRGGFDSPAGSCRRTFGAEHKLVPARRGQQLLVDQRKRSSPRRWLASGARTRWSFETAS